MTSQNLDFDRYVIDDSDSSLCSLLNNDEDSQIDDL